MEELRQVALELLDAWDSAERAVIQEYSGHVAEELAELSREVSELRERIASIT